ncbi:MAG: GtrA family protein [Tannerella sp.]|jgi:putative flippase GtrA|nr:GtrA family protein [Tannerella sp.]
MFLNASIFKHLLKFAEFIKFCLVGGMMTVFNFILYYIYNEFCDFNYLVSNLVSYAIAVTVSYFINVVFTFNANPHQKGIKKFFEYFLMRFAVLGVESLLLFTMVDIAGINKYGSKIIITGILFLITFRLSRRIIAPKVLKEEK